MKRLKIFEFVLNFLKNLPEVQKGSKTDGKQ